MRNFRTIKLCMVIFLNWTTAAPSCTWSVSLSLSAYVKVFMDILINSHNLRPGRHTPAHPQISVIVVRLAESSTNMRTSCGPRPGSVLGFRQRGLCGGGLCHAIRMCGSVLWVLRKRARSSALSAGLITAWKNWGQQERHAGILPRPGHCSLFTASNPRGGRRLESLFAGLQLYCHGLLCSEKTKQKENTPAHKTHRQTDPGCNWLVEVGGAFSS